MSLRSPSGKASQGGPSEVAIGGSSSRCEGQFGTAPTQAFHTRASLRRAAVVHRQSGGFGAVAHEFVDDALIDQASGGMPLAEQ